MALDLAHINDISRGLRGLCLGRVYLKEDCDTGDTTIKVGDDQSAALGGLDIPGSQFFRNNSLAAVLVEPNADDVPGTAGIDHSESVTLAEPSGCPLHLTADAAVAAGYTVVAGAYIALADPPAVCDGLRIIVKDFTEDGVAPEEKFLPGIFVTWQGTEYPSTQITAYSERMTFLIRYAILEEDGVDNRATLLTGLEQLTNLIAEDNYLGGTVHESNVLRVVPCWRQDSQRRGQVVNAEGRQILWADIVISTARTVGWDKVSVA